MSIRSTITNYFVDDSKKDMGNIKASVIHLGEACISIAKATMYTSLFAYYTSMYSLNIIVNGLSQITDPRLEKAVSSLYNVAINTTKAVHHASASIVNLSTAVVTPIAHKAAEAVTYAAVYTYSLVADPMNTHDISWNWGDNSDSDIDASNFSVNSQDTHDITLGGDCSD